MQQSKENVILIVMPGAGKSTVGVVLAKLGTVVYLAEIAEAVGQTIF